MKLLQKISEPKDLKKLKLSQLPSLCQEIRDFILKTVSKAGGHLASNLGSVELTVALHYIFESPKDKICWDVGHQTYVHKILTGRKDLIENIRKTSGLSGFPKTEESKHDHYNTGHAGTSISQALGEAVARDLLQKKGKRNKCDVIAVTGDASIVSGMSFEAMNHAGDIKAPVIVILNDNEMSISKNVGALNYTFSNIISTISYFQQRNKLSNILKKKFFSVTWFRDIFLRFRSSVKGFITKNHFFEALGFRYLGPIDGHDVIKLIRIMKRLRYTDNPTVLHLVTKKGKGYEPAEKDPVGYHGVTPFETATGIMKSASKSWNFSKFVGACLSELAKKDPKICVITPAMKEGSGLVKFAERYPNRFFDVGIAEQHATTFSGALAKAGMRPFLCVYSTFLQRAYDQFIQDISLMDLPVRMVLDRAGCVGGDGETHQGLYDIAFMSCIPNAHVLSAKDPLELCWMLAFMSQYEKHPVSVRFPKKSFDLRFFDDWLERSWFPKGWSPFQSEIIEKGSDAVIFTEGVMVEQALEVRDKLLNRMVDLEVVSLKSLRPLDKKNIEKIIHKKSFIFTLENHVYQGGMGYSIQNIFSSLLKEKIFKPFAYPEKPIPHGSIKEIEKKYGLDPESIAKDVYKYCQDALVKIPRSA